MNTDTDIDTNTHRSRAATDGLSKDEMFHLLSNQRRRDALEYLAEHDGAVNMRDLAEWIAAREHETTVAQLTSDERQRVYIALYQSHLPKLADYGVIEYNQSRGVVRRGAHADQLDLYLEFERSETNDVDGTTGADTGTGTDAGIRLPVSLSSRSGLGVGAVGVGMIVIGLSELLPAMLLLAITWIALIVAISPIGTTGLVGRTRGIDR